MKILMIIDNFPPEVVPPAIRTSFHCARWAECGHAVTVITLNPNFPSGRIFSGYRNKLYQRERRDGYELVRVWSFIAPNEGFLARILDFLSFTVASFVAGLFEKPDVIITSSPHLFLGLSARALAFVKRKPWVFEVRDLWPESIVALGMMRRGTAYRVLEALELHFYRSARAVVILSEGFRKSLSERGISSEKVFFVPNGVDLLKFAPLAPDPKLKASLGLEGKFVVGFIGTIGLAHGLDLVLDCAPRLSRENTHFLFIGAGAKKAELVARVEKEKIGNVTFCDVIPHEDVPRFMALCDAALINLKASETFLSVIPSKIFEAAALERPMLLGVDGVARDIVERHGAGLFFAPGDADALVAAVRRLRDDRRLYAELQAGCRNLARAYDRNVLAARVLEILEKCAAPG